MKPKSVKIVESDSSHVNLTYERSASSCAILDRDPPVIIQTLVLRNFRLGLGDCLETPGDAGTSLVIDNTQLLVDCVESVESRPPQGVVYHAGLCYR